MFFCSFSDAWQLPCLEWKAHKTKVEKTVSFMRLCCDSVVAKHCQALPWTRKMQALNNKDEGGGNNLSPAALGQLMDIPKRGLRGGIGASNL